MPNPNTVIDRRRFLKQSAWGLGVSFGGTHLLGPAPQRHTAAVPADEARIIVFQGDSITDAGRHRDGKQANSPYALGSGYAGIAAAQLLGEHPGSPWQCYNRGVSGDKVFQLAERWETDCLDLTPDVLSILIGVNDFWHTLTHDYDGTAETYERDYRALLDRTREALPEVRLIIGEPFVLMDGAAVEADQWRPAFDAYRAAARRVADEYGTAWIPYQTIFDEALRQAPVSYWAPDGVHPSPAGHYLMAQAWLDALEKVTE